MASGKAPSGTAVDESRKLLRQMSHQSSEGNESVVSEELELLTNVYLDELDISYSEKGNVVLKYHLTPSTADDKDKQFVYLDLTITLSVMYPNLKPEILFGESRGLSDAHLRGIAEGLYHKSLEYLGSPMVYELVEYAKDCLTDNNRPCGQCAICQFDFEETDDFTKTECYHYFHLPCLARYVEFFECQQREGEMEECRADLMLRKKPKQLECPVCREPISTGSTCLDAIQGVVSSSSATDNSEAFRPSEELRSWQAHMASLLRQQKEKGGVIDPSREDDTIDETWVSSARSKKIGENSEVEEQLPHQLQEQEKRVRAVQHVSSDDALSQIRHVDIQSLDCGSEHPPPDGGVPSESNVDICRGSENAVGTQHVREKHTDSRLCPHSITSNSGSESISQNDNPDSKPLMGGLHSRPHDGSHSRPHDASNSRPSHDRSHSRQYDDSHSRPHDRSHSRPHNGSHSRPHDGSYSRPHDGSHSRPHDGSHSRPHDGSHSRPHDGSHFRPHNGSHSRQYDDSYSRQQDRSHFRPHGSHFKPYKGPHPRPEHRSRDPRRDYRTSQQSAGRRQTGGSDLPSGSRGDHRRRDRRRYDHVQDENYQNVRSVQPTKDYHGHRHRDSKPKSVGAGQMVNAGVKEEGMLFEGRTVTRSEQGSREEPSTERPSSREQGSQRHPVSGRNEHRGSSHEMRESGYSKNHWSRGRAEKRGRNKYQECVSPCTTEK